MRVKVYYICKCKCKCSFVYYVEPITVKNKGITL